jgi:hypothetical protein
MSAVAGFLAMVIVLAHRNHRWTEPGIAAAARQLVTLAAYVMVSAAAFGNVPTLLLWILVSR